MATKKTSATGTSNKTKTKVPQPTVAELRQWYETTHNKESIVSYADANNALMQLRDVNKSTRYKNITPYSKDTVNTYIQNISANEKNLRTLSRYLTFRSMVYYRLQKYYASQIDLSIRSVIPTYSLSGKNNPKTTISNYEQTVTVLDSLHLQQEAYKAALVSVREDVFYGCSYYTEGQGCLWLPLDPDYCKINGTFWDGSFSFEMDMSYFNRNADLLEFWGEPFQSMFREYESSNVKYQQMPEEYAVCFKFRNEDWETVVPPLVAMFLDFISLTNKADIQDIQDEADIYKMIWLKMDTIGNDVDDWTINPETMVAYFNKMCNEALPDYITAAIVPGELQEISFPDDTSSEITKVEKATKEILNSAGGAQILNLGTASNSVAFANGLLNDARFILSSLVPQIQAVVNRLLKSYVSEDHAKVKYFEVGAYQKDDFRKSLLESAQNSLPTKLMCNTLNGFSELETMALNYLEEECLQLSQKLVPFQSSYTQSSSDTNEKDATELTDEGLKTRDQDKNNK